MDTDPEPNGVATTFAVPNSHLLTGTLTVFVNGTVAVPTAIDLDKGAFTLATAPAVGAKVFGSYYFQWFGDAELQEFIEQASGMLGYEDPEDASLSVQLRTPILSFAAYYAYMKMAALTADTMAASSAGFTSDTTKQHPYWMNLARMAWEQAQKELETVNEITPLTTIAPAMKFTAFRLARYVPRT